MTTDSMKKVLIIDDDRNIVDVLSRKLANEGFKVETALDGKTGLKKTLDWRPDLLLLDIVLPEIDGLTLLDKLRATEFGNKLHIIILTNLEGAEKVEKSRKDGVHDYLVKTDWKLDDVVIKIRSVLENK